MPKKWVAVCPVCEQPIDTVANPNAALDIATGEWYHGPCSRYMNVVLDLKYGASSGRFDSSKPNLANTPKYEVSSGRFDSSKPNLANTPKVGNTVTYKGEFYTCI